MKAIFFDLDGVLVLSEDVHLEAWKEVLRKKGLDSGLLSIRDIFGVPDKSIAEQIATRTKRSFDPMDLCALKREIYLKNYVSFLKSPDGRDQFLQRAKEKFEMAVVSSTTRIEIEAILKVQKIAHYFKFFIGFEDVKKPKPDPEPYLSALKKSHYRKEEVCAIEDSPVGIRSALSAGLKVLGLNSSLRPQDFPSVLFFRDFFALAKDFF